jgi:hypothetical protein
MQALGAATFVDKGVPTTAQTYNAWNLHVCTQQVGASVECMRYSSINADFTQQCDFTHAADIARLYGHPTVHGIAFDEVTFSMCNRGYVICNQRCQAQYDKDMLDWPRPETNWPILTSSELTLCIGTCNSEAVIDHQYIANATHKPPNLSRDANLAFCYQKISACSQNCQVGLNKEIKDFQKDHNQ